MQNQLRKRRFTLIEMMVAMGVFMILLTLLLNFFSGTRQVWKTLRDRNDSFEKARVAMDIVTDLLTTSVADAGNVGFWVPTTNDSCTFVTRTTRNLSSADPAVLNKTLRHPHRNCLRSEYNHGLLSRKERRS